MKNLTLLLLSIFLAPLLFAQSFAEEQLENSPRHHEWVEIVHNNRTLHSFIAYPEVSEDALVVIVIHENRGLDTWARSFADQLAAAGYIAIAPDLLSGMNEDYPRTMDYPSVDAARNALSQLNPNQVTADLLAAQNYSRTIPASNGKVVVAGFCWGGSQTFRFATNSDGIEAALVFYGSATNNEEAIQRITAPVYGFYGGNDQRINATIPATEELMEKHGKFYEYRMYEGAGHAYMRTGDDPEGAEANVNARNASWEWLKEILSGI
jgi:carboxymethylenebutenolidase